MQLPNVNDHIIAVLELSRKMLILADLGDSKRKDAGCGIIFGTLRDDAFKLRKIALEEIEKHQKNNNWNKEADLKLNKLKFSVGETINSWK